MYILIAKLKKFLENLLGFKIQSGNLRHFAVQNVRVIGKTLRNIFNLLKLKAKLVSKIYLKCVGFELEF